VKDTGIGIAPDQLPRIFQMFSQIDRSLEKSQGGLGIGLALVRRLVEMHGGSIEVKSDGVGKGSEFIVRMPVMIEATRLQAMEREEIASSKTSFRVLIVDDNRDAADSLGMMLRLTGHQPKTAYDGQAALAIAEEFRPDVMLLDIGLPKLSGHEVAQRIREQPWGRQIVLIALTGWSQDEDRERSKSAGFDYHLVKPVDFATLMKLLADLSLSIRV